VGRADRRTHRAVQGTDCEADIGDQGQNLAWVSGGDESGGYVHIRATSLIEMIDAALALEEEDE
jgi:hypothetical protein